MNLIVAPVPGLRHPNAEMLSGAALPAALLKKQHPIKGTGQSVTFGFNGTQAVQLEHRNGRPLPSQPFRRIQYGKRNAPIGDEQNAGVASAKQRIGFIVRPIPAGAGSSPPLG